ncbi:uncharacterized protein LOC120091645 [Benincasa hispida]|uniref:uncharacterized protein LOC120091645 n=1 Tax=Benincasa hispida TaxID=102211 RepID=UPI001900D430|nr:uncharacterized protein LOC120091645 [Benincasa hispida]
MLFHHWLLHFTLIATLFLNLEAIKMNHQTIKTQTFLSPLFTLTPGSVVEKFFYNLNFPKGHIAIKSFDAEVIDEESNPVSLFDAYLHHWTLVRYYQHNKTATNHTNDLADSIIIAGNSGGCQPHTLSYFYGMGTESRKTSNFLPNPYGIEVGNEKEVPLGYEEKWILNVHVIDTRGVEDRIGCLECRCDLYNVNKDELEEDYKGGFKCCYDTAQCKVREGYEGEERNLYVKYTVKWVDWDDDFVIPVKVYVFDATDTWKPLTDSTGQISQQHDCQVEYDVESCSLISKLDGECNAIKRSKVMFQDNGFLVYGVAHQHIGGIGATLYGQDGRVLCSSSPIYGKGDEIGNEDGYVVGMSTCYPKFGHVKINKGELGTLVSKYDPAQNHTGVMGIFSIVVATKLPNSLFHMEV